MLSKRATSTQISQVKKILGYPHKNLPITYLGCPLYVGRLKDCIFEDLISRVQHRIAAWENNSLSMGGRIILLKSIINSMSIHLFHMLQPPGCTLKRLEKVYNSFLWGSKTEHKRMHWRSWERICYPKEEGGLGFRLPMDTASAFAMKLWWRFRTSDCMWTKFMNMRYGRKKQAQLMEAKKQDSNCWKRMCKAKTAAEDNIIWGIGVGNLSFWHDQWLNGGRLIDLHPINHSPQYLVADFLTEREWNMNKLKEILPDQIANTICEIPINMVDHAYWKGATNSDFSTKSAWEQIRQSKPTSELFKRLWHNAIPLRKSVLAWRALNGLIPVDKTMQKFGIALASKCQCCHDVETLEHVFLNNPKACMVWNYFNSYFGLPSYPSQSIECLLSGWWFSHDLVQCGHIRILLPILIIWNLWHARNEAKHNNYSIQSKKIIVKTELQIINLVKAGVIKARNYRGDESFSRKFGLNEALGSKERIIIFKWIKPAKHWFKLNIDGSSHGNPGPSAAGGLLRDDCGKVSFIFSWPLGLKSALYAELAAACEGLQICRQIGIQRVWIESDSKILVESLNGNQCGNWSTFSLISKIRAHLCGMDWRCTHIWREGNQAADFLANRGVHAANPVVLFAPLLRGRLKGIIALDAAGMEQFRSSSSMIACG